MVDRAGKAVLEHLLSFPVDETIVLGQKNGNLIIAITCWFLWRERRKLLHGERTQQPAQIVLSVRTLAGNFLAVTAKPAKEKRNPSTRLQSGYTKLNVDASFDPDLLQGTVGAVLRETTGNFLAASNNIVGVCMDVFMVEALALRFGLNLTTSMGCNKWILNSDNSDLISTMQDGGNSSGTSAAILDDCYHMARDFSHTV